MTFKIVRRHFAKVSDKWAETEDLRHRGIAFDRTWSSFCVFFGSSEAARLKQLCEQNKKVNVDVIPCLSSDGTWVMGAYYQLEMLLASEMT
jgi:hypothetical protein